ncbi:hypothetical protein NCCP133_14540 [Cytobacillus sp. NCCP-133]|nr:hypothetical protein NCCP133_14540 [Cytobacillus sp. NCCP-133]
MGDAAAECTRRDEEKNRQTVIKQEQKQNVRLGNDDRSNQKGREEKDRNDKQKQGNTRKQNHPYKGKVIDYSG